MILYHFWVDPGSLWGYLGIILASFWHHFRSFWCRFDPICSTLFGYLWAISARFSGPFLRSFCDFLVMFWEVDSIIKQNDAREWNICKFPPNITKMMQNCPKRKLFSGYQILVLLFKKNGQNRRFNLSKCAASGCARNGLGWILRVFMQFYEGLDTFEPFLITFDPFWAIFDPIWSSIEPFLGTMLGPK